MQSGVFAHIYIYIKLRSQQQHTYAMILSRAHSKVTTCARTRTTKGLSCKIYIYLLFAPHSFFSFFFIFFLCLLVGRIVAFIFLNHTFKINEW